MLSNLFGRSSVSDETQKTIVDFFSQYEASLFKGKVAQSCKINKIEKDKDNIAVKISAPFPCDTAFGEFADALLERHNISILCDIDLDVLPVQKHGISSVKNLIAVSSGKGGVGKSTTAVNLAFALQAEGANVGILDADVYGPSIPKMLGLSGKRVGSDDGKTMIPMESNGIAAMSIGFLTEENDATIWRGPMASRAFGQMLNETSWPELDYLIIDMPPGTGDIQLTLAQQVPVAGAVVITTPQDVALIDAEKGMAMFNKVNVPVLGLIENMSYHLCENCGHKSHLFGQGGAEALASKFDASVLGQLPLDIDICQQVDNGSCTVLENSTSEVAVLYRKIAQKMAAHLYFNHDARSPFTKEILFTQID